jgi:hypothetical protein
MATRASATVRPSPNRLASHGAANPAAEKHSTGKVVSIPAQIDEVPSAPRISPSSGATLVTEGRRFSAIRTTAAASNTPPATLVGGDAVVTSMAPSSSRASPSSMGC